ncbi:alpha/beta hydrolase [Cupriavidus sp. TMH.W2]|uniref:alpha/beta hydrolase n=1 Tax=Cupriavidus sp. TMH.W2 TaxID=3434465 RepID=UPI003D78642D
MTTYAQQANWREIQRFLPIQYQLTQEEEPQEEWWAWRQHRIHLDCYRNAAAPLKVILIHGLGTNGRQMSTIAGAPLARYGVEAIAIDMPEYGLTEVGPGKLIRYDDWVQAGSDLVDAESAKDDRPIVLYGFSAGGLESYHIAAKNRKVKGIVGMTFFDPRVQQVRDETAINWFMSRVGSGFAKLAARTPFGGIRLPIAGISKMQALVNDKAALKVCLADKTSAGKWVTMGFMASYINYVPAAEPEDFDVCPILLTQPEQDHWTPLHLSELFLGRIRHVPVQIVMLQNAGHYPLEQPGLNQMVSAIHEFCLRVVANAHVRV